MSTTYAQTTIHSKVAKFEKGNDCSFGNIFKGTIRKSKAFHGTRQKTNNQLQKQIEILPKTKSNVVRKIRNKIISSINKQDGKDEIILMQSGVFPAIYYKKTTMRNVLKQFTFPNNVRSLPPNDTRIPLIFQIISNLFNEITFFIFNILIGQNIITESFYIFFSDSQTIPFTKCCNAPVYIELMQNGSGKVLCNSAKCPHSNLAEFLINFQDGRKLWKNLTYFINASKKDKQLRQKISKLINNGQYKKISLVNVVQDTSKQIINLFYDSKEQNQSLNDETNNNNNNNNNVIQDEQNPFLTANNNNNNNNNNNSNNNSNNNINEQIDLKQQINKLQITTQDILSPQQNNDIDILKIKLNFMTRNQKQFTKKISQQLVDQSKIFHKNFDMIKKIDSFLVNQKKITTHSTKFNFPKIMNQINKQNTNKANNSFSQPKEKSITVKNSFL